jgi:hypothetical protein
MASYEDELAIFRAVLAPVQMVLDFRGLAVFVDAEEADVEVVAGELEVVHVAPEEGDRRLGRHDELHFGVALVAIEVVFAALVERHDLALEPRRVL